MLKIDSHQHFWNRQRFNYPWLSPQAGPLWRDFEPSDLAPLLAESGIDGTISVQASHSQAETEWLLELARFQPFIKGVVGWLDLTAPDLTEQLDALKEQGPLVGLRHQVHDEPDSDWLLQPQVIAGLKTLAAQNLTYDLLVRPPHLKYLPALLERVPDMRWVVDHLAKPFIKSGQIEPWLTELGQVARYPNVYCKVSGMITEADHQHWQPTDLQPYFEGVLNLFGPNRLMFGSDWPVCLLAGSYVQVQDLTTQLVSRLSESEQAAVWGGTALEAYQLQGSSTISEAASNE